MLFESLSVPDQPTASWSENLPLRDGLPGDYRQPFRNSCGISAI